MRQEDIEFFKKEMVGGIEVFFYGTYKIDGDFGTFSKIISTLKLSNEQVNMFENIPEMKKFLSEYAGMLERNDPDCSVTFEYKVVEK